MSTQEAIISILQKLSPYRDLAEGYIAMVENAKADKKLIEQLCHIFAEVIRTTKSQLIKKEFEESLHTLGMIQAKEKSQQVEDKQAAEDILADWNNK